VIKFYWDNGVASIPKEFIRSIGFIKETPVMTPPNQKESVPEPMAVVSKEKNTAVMTPPNQKEPVPEPKAVVSKEKNTAELNAEKEKIDVGYYKKQKAFFTEKYQQAYERYLEASSRRDQEAKKKTWEEFNRYGGQVSALEEDLKKQNQGVLPKWWNE
jgi:hypothetical protein